MATVENQEYKLLDLPSLKDGDQVVGVLVVSKKSEEEARNKKKYFKVTLANSTGQIMAFAWDEYHEYFQNVNAGDAVQIKGKKDQYGVKLQGVQKIEGEHPIFDDLNPKYEGELDDLLAEYDSLVNQIEHPGYRQFLKRFFEVGCPWEDYIAAPAALKNHHAYIHGLLHHSIQVVKNALAAIEGQELDETMVNKDLVIAAGLIHDSGKIHEYEWKGMPLRMARNSVLFGHITTGPNHVARTMGAYEEELADLGFTQEDADHLMHVQVSHHREKEWGSPVEPATLTAELIHRADYMSAGIQKMREFVVAAKPDQHGFYEGNRSAGFWKGAMADPKLPKPLTESVEVEEEAPAEKQEKSQQKMSERGEELMERVKGRNEAGPGLEGLFQDMPDNSTEEQKKSRTR